jgi:hypothetical protein
MHEYEDKWGKQLRIIYKCHKNGVEYTTNKLSNELTHGSNSDTRPRLEWKCRGCKQIYYKEGFR